MCANELVKRNLSGMQVLKTLLLLLQDNLTMSELIEKLNEKEDEPIFNHSVVSKYINTCRYCGIEILKIQNKYFISKLPFGLDLTQKDLEIIKKMENVALEQFSSKSLNVFNYFLQKLNKYSNKDIVKIENKTIQLAYKKFEKAVQEKRKVLLIYKSKQTLECIPISIENYKNKTCFKVLNNNSENYIPTEKISGMKLLGKTFIGENYSVELVTYKLYNDLAQKYTLRENEDLITSDLPNSITIMNRVEDKDELISRLLRYDKYCEIISPLSYRNEIKCIINNMLNNYGIE